MRVKYQGPLDRVRLRLSGRREVVISRGETVDVPDELGESLLDQSDWARGSKPRQKDETEPVPAGDTTDKED